jgi:hypothetical protein
MYTKTAPAITIETYPVTLDPTVSLEGQINAGNYAFVDEHYTPQNFPLTLTGQREVMLFDPLGNVSSEEMIALMKADKCVPATIDDCLAFGTTFPERQRKNPIVFLGTVFHDPNRGRHVPVLRGWVGGRSLYLGWFVDRWSYGCRFAAVRES